MKRYMLDPLFGGHLCSHQSGPDNSGDVTVEIWRDGRPASIYLTLHPRHLTELDPPGAPTAEQVLSTPMGHNDAGAATIGEYLAKLLGIAWRDRDNWNPFGNSGWSYELYDALAASGYLAFTENVEWGQRNYDEETANRMIVAAIKTLVRPVTP